MRAFGPRSNGNYGAVSVLGHAAGESVQVIRIDDLRLGRCDLIKVDVEGMERDVYNERHRQESTLKIAVLRVDVFLVVRPSRGVEASTGLGRVAMPHRHRVYWIRSPERSRATEDEIP
jgi:hypothetical protein